MLFYNSSKGYGALPQAAHWLTVVLVAIAWTLGIFGDELPRGPQRDAGLFVHMSAGLAVLVLLVIRLALNLFNAPRSTAPTTAGVWSARLAAATHYALYVLLVAVPAAGIALQFARGGSVSVFGLAEIASPWVRNVAFSRTIKEVHEVLANTLILVAGLHAAAALIHHWVLRDKTLVRMLPRFDD